MPKPLSEDLRVRKEEAVEAGRTIRAVGEQFEETPSSVSTTRGAGGGLEA